MEQLLNFIFANNKVKKLVNFHLLSVLQVHFLELMLDLTLKSEEVLEIKAYHSWHPLSPRLSI